MDFWHLSGNEHSLRDQFIGNGAHGYHHIAVEDACRMARYICIVHGYVFPFFYLPYGHPSFQQVTFKGETAAYKEAD